jgi:uncharacterized protein YecE (DUF72 family)
MADAVDAIPALYIGTQGWNYPDWVGTFYPPGTKPKEMLRLFSGALDTVEIDSTFYGTPRPSAVQGWAESTPPGFRFAAKLPRQITHEAMLRDADADLAAFLRVMDGLGDKLGPLLIQLPPQFHRDEQTWADVRAFLAALPGGYQWAIEFRHRSWLGDETLDLLRERGVAWTCIDLEYMPRVVAATADFAYVRWLGDRRQIERYNRIQIDRSREADEWAEALVGLARHVRRIYGYFNNHYAGHSPASINLLRARLGLPPVPRPAEPGPLQGQLW